MYSGMPGDGMYSGMPGDGMYTTGMPGDGMYSDMYPGDGGYGWTDDYTDMPGYGGRRCCPLKAVESPSDESMNEMYALVERVPWSQVKENCSSNCAYVKMKDLMMVMDEMKNMTDNMANMTTDGDMEATTSSTQDSRLKGMEDYDMMDMLFGKEYVMKMKIKMMMERLPKFCFMP